MDTIVITTWTNWTEPPRIRHQMARQFARQFLVLFIEVPKWRGQLKTTEVLKVEERILRCRLADSDLPVGLFSHVPIFRRFYVRSILRQLEEVVHQHATQRRILINFNFDMEEVMQSPLWFRRVYVCNDDFQSQAGHFLRKWFVQFHQSRVADAADVCLAVSPFLVKQNEKYNPATLLFLPGHDLHIPSQSLYETVLSKRKNSRIKVGFVGFLNRRVNVEWIMAVAQQPDMEIHLVGPIDDRNIYNRLSVLDHAHFHDSLLGNELLEFLYEMDVLTIPYDVYAPGVSAMAVPNKTFIYFAAGKPIVISKMPDFASFPEDRVYIAEDLTDYLHNIRLAWQRDCPEFIVRRKKIAVENHWDLRGEELFGIIDRLLKNSDESRV